MAEAAEARTSHLVAAEGPVKSFFRATEIDTRLLGMIGALILIWVGFQIFGQILTGDGVFLTPRNLWNLLVQTSAIAVMSTGMVLIIVMRHIDLSVGSMLSFIGVVTGVAQVYWLAPWLGSGHPVIWIVGVVIALGVGALLGAFNGFLVAYAGIPSFIVTLGGLIVYNGAAWWVIRGETVAPMDSRFELIGGNVARLLDWRRRQLGARRGLFVWRSSPAYSSIDRRARDSNFRSVRCGRRRFSSSSAARLRWGR